jgi:tRNA (guanine-N7-)-methyltransferase
MARRATGGARPRREFYGRRSGKTLRPNQKRLMAELLPRVALAGVDVEANPERRVLPAGRVGPAGRPVWLEIGFGGGEHLAAQAAAHPEVDLIGAESFVNGVATLLGHVEARGLGNVRVHFGDARDLLEVLPTASVARVFLLYPDPWPKARHHRRRFVNAENLAALARIMAPGAELRIASDIPDYVDACARGTGRGARLRAGGGGTAGLGGTLARLARNPLRGEGAARRQGAALPDLPAGLRPVDRPGAIP